MFGEVISWINKYSISDKNIFQDNSPLHEIQRDPNFDQMVDKMTPKVTKEKPSRKRENNSGGGGANGSAAE